MALEKQRQTAAGRFYLVLTAGLWVSVATRAIWALEDFKFFYALFIELSCVFALFVPLGGIALLFWAFSDKRPAYYFLGTGLTADGLLFFLAFYLSRRFAVDFPKLGLLSVFGVILVLYSVSLLMQLRDVKSPRTG